MSNGQNKKNKMLISDLKKNTYFFNIGLEK